MRSPTWREETPQPRRERGDPTRVLCDSFRTLQPRLEEERSKLYGRMVYVHCNQYQGYGTATRDDCWPDKVAVRIENGNVWWYPLDSVMVCEFTALSFEAWQLLQEGQIETKTQTPQE